MERKAQAIKAARASNSKQKQAEASQRKPKQARASWSAQELPKRAQGTPQVPPEAHFLRISLFSNVVCFSCRSLCFVFCSAYLVNLSTLSSKLNCGRQQAKARKSKQQQAKGSQRKQEPPRVQVQNQFHT